MQSYQPHLHFGSSSEIYTLFIIQQKRNTLFHIKFYFNSMKMNTDSLLDNLEAYHK